MDINWNYLTQNQEDVFHRAMSNTGHYKKNALYELLLNVLNFHPSLENVIVFQVISVVF